MSCAATATLTRPEATWVCFPEETCTHYSTTWRLGSRSASLPTSCQAASRLARDDRAAARAQPARPRALRPRVGALQGAHALHAVAAAAGGSEKHFQRDEWHLSTDQWVSRRQITADTKRERRYIVVVDFRDVGSLYLYPLPLASRLRGYIFIGSENISRSSFSSYLRKKKAAASSNKQN